MKILWLSNCELTVQPTKTTGSWLQAMSAALVERGDVELCNITIGRVKSITRRDCGSIKQWIVPRRHLKDGLPPMSVVNGVVELVGEINPDLVHIWGVELYWGLLSARGYIKHNTLLEIQGLRHTCAEVWYGGLSVRERVESVQLKEVFRAKKRIDTKQRREKKWGRYEKEIIAAHRYISVPSEWVRATIAPLCGPGTVVMDSRMAVRREFFEAAPWKRPSLKDGVELLVMSSAPIPYKGVHVVLKALAVVKQYNPNVRLTIVGDYEQNKKKWSKSGYLLHLERQIRRLGLQENIALPGALSAEELVEQMQKTHVMIHSSFVESYSLALAESMVVGVPSVVAWSGAMPELAQDGKEALFYSPTDYRRCAWLVCRLVDNVELAESVSSQARKRGLERNTTSSVVEHQVECYRRVIDEYAAS